MSRLAHERDRGGEHVVYNSTEGPDRVFKITHPGQAGLAIVTRSNRYGEPVSTIGSATPAEYLERMILVNELFQDAICLEGIIEGDQPSLIISQPKLAGTLPDAAGINSSLQDLGFERVDTLIWYRQQDGIAIADTKRSNFIETPDGQVLPIDISACLATVEMAASWNLPPPPQTSLRRQIETWRRPQPV